MTNIIFKDILLHYQEKHSNVVPFEKVLAIKGAIESLNEATYPEQSEPQPEELGGAERTSPDINAILIDKSANFFLEQKSPNFV